MYDTCEIYLHHNGIHHHEQAYTYRDGDVKYGKSVQVYRHRRQEPAYKDAGPHTQKHPDRQEFLKEGKDLSVEMQFLLFAGQMISEKEKIAKLRKEKIIVCDRYFAGTLVYQGLKGFDWQKGLRFANDFHLEIPDTIFYLDTPVDVARERKQQEEGKKILDRHEADFEFTKKVDQKYRELIKKKVFAKWIMIDNTKTIDEVTENIVNITNKLIEGGRNTK